MFVETGAPWSTFLESILLHLAVISVAITLSQTWISRQSHIEQTQYRQSLLYYMPSKSYPAIGSRAPAPPKVHRQAAHQSAVHQSPIHTSPIKVAHERNHSPIKPPDLKLAQTGHPDIMGANSPRPTMPLFAPKLSDLTVPAAPTSVVAPAPGVQQVVAQPFSLPQEAVVAPVPVVASVSSRPGLSAPNAQVVAPTPKLQGMAAAGRSQIVAVRSQIIPPPPQLGVGGQRDMSRTSSLAGGPGVVPPTPSDKASALFAHGNLISGVEVVAPSPSLQSVSNSAEDRRMSALVAGAPVVPPAPSVRGEGNSAEARRMASLSGGVPVVAPAPSIGVESNSGRGRRGNSLSAAGSTVVAPVPSVRGVGTSAQGRRVASLSASGLPVAGPAPSVRGGSSSARRTSAQLGGGAPVAGPVPSLQGGGNEGESRRLGSLSGGGTEAVAPAPTMNVGDSKESRSMAMNSTAAVEPPPTMNRTSDPATVELPVRVIGLAVALPGTSYFSNYEVFIAERRIGQTETELIKLVYVSLPYQKRLTEYGFDNAKVYKLRVTRDHTCDETLLAMTWPEANDNQSGEQDAAGPPTLPPGESNNLLPCYKTTADDYQRAVLGSR